MKRGDVFWADLAPRSGSEQSGRRPVVVVSHDSLNQAATWRSVIVVPVSTSQRQGRRGLTAIALPAGSADLSRDSLAVCHQVTTLDKSKLSQFIGTLPPSTLREVEEGLRVSMDLE